MKTSNFFYILLAILISSCGQDKNNNADEFGFNQEFSNENGQNMEAMNNNQENGNSFSGQENQNSYKCQRASDEKKSFKLKDVQGIVFGIYLIPQNWKKGSGDNFLESGDGVKVTNDVINEFNY